MITPNAAAAAAADYTSTPVSLLGAPPTLTQNARRVATNEITSAM